MNQTVDVIVIGAGPAGCAAATHAARCRWSVTAIDRAAGDGYLGSLGAVDYFPGCAETIRGVELLQRMRRRAETAGVQMVTDVARALVGQAGPFRLMTESGREFEAKAVVVATGAALRTNYLQNEREFVGRGVSHDAPAVAPSLAGRSVAVIGKTRHAVEEALVLARFAERVHLIIPSSKLDAEDAQLQQLHRQRAIELHFSTSLKKINGSDWVSSVTVLSGGQEKEIPVTGAIVCAHEYQPTTGFLDKAVELSPGGAVEVDAKLCTSVEGIFACGDVLCGRPQEPAIAVAQGILAGIHLDQRLLMSAARS